MAWWVWALIMWGALASAAVIYLAGALSIHEELRQELLEERKRPRDHGLQAADPIDSASTPGVRIRAARIWATEVCRRVSLGQ